MHFPCLPGVTCVIKACVKRFLPLIAVLLTPLATASAQEPEAEVATPVEEASQYFAPDWIPGTTELYYGPSFLDRNLTPVNMTTQVDLGLMDYHSRNMPKGGAEHVGALFFALEEEAQPSFPITEVPTPGGNCCSMVRPQEPRQSTGSCQTPN